MASLFAPHRLALLRKVAEAGLLQVLGFAISILVVRILSADSKESFGCYGFALVLQGGLNLLIDAGVSIGLVSQAGKAWPDRDRVGGVFAAAIRQRNLLILLFLPPLEVYSIWQQIAMKATPREAFLITALSFATCLIQAQINLHQTLLGLAGRFVQSQRLGLVASLIRLALTASILYWIDPLLALLTSLFASSLELFLKSRSTRELVNFSMPPDPESLLGFRRLSYALLPSTAFYIVQSNLPLILPGFNGDNQHMAAFRAEFSALSRLALPIGLLGTLAMGFLVPHFAKLPPAELKPFLKKTFGATGAFALCVALAGWLLSDALLWTIGPTYAHLGRELSLILLLSAVNFLLDTMYALCQARAWLAHVWLGSAGTLLVQVLFFRFFDLNTIIGAVCFSALSFVPRSMVVLFLFIRGLSGKGLLVKNAV